MRRLEVLAAHTAVTGYEKGLGGILCSLCRGGCTRDGGTKHADKVP